MYVKNLYKYLYLLITYIVYTIYVWLTMQNIAPLLSMAMQKHASCSYITYRYTDC